MQASDISIHAVASEGPFYIHSNIEKDIKLDIDINKNHKDGFQLYIAIENTERLSFNGKENNDDLYVPGGIGSDGWSDSIYRNLVFENKAPHLGNELFLYGIGVADQDINRTEFPISIYLNKTPEFQEFHKPVLVCVYYKDIIGYRYHWTKIVPIEIAS